METWFIWCNFPCTTWISFIDQKYEAKKLGDTNLLTNRDLIMGNKANQNRDMMMVVAYVMVHLYICLYTCIAISMSKAGIFMEYDVGITTKLWMNTCPEMGYTVYWYTPRYKWLFAKMQRLLFGLGFLGTPTFRRSHSWMNMDGMYWYVMFLVDSWVTLDRASQ